MIVRNAVIAMDAIKAMQCTGGACRGGSAGVRRSGEGGYPPSFLLFVLDAFWLDLDRLWAVLAPICTNVSPIGSICGQLDNNLHQFGTNLR